MIATITEGQLNIQLVTWTDFPRPVGKPHKWAMRVYIGRYDHTLVGKWFTASYIKSYLVAKEFVYHYLFIQGPQVRRRPLFRLRISFYQKHAEQAP